MRSSKVDNHMAVLSPPPPPPPRQMFQQKTFPEQNSNRPQHHGEGAYAAPAPFPLYKGVVPPPPPPPPPPTNLPSGQFHHGMMHAQPHSSHPTNTAQPHASSVVNGYAEQVITDRIRDVVRNDSLESSTSAAASYQGRRRFWHNPLRRNDRRKKNDVSEGGAVYYGDVMISIRPKTSSVRTDHSDRTRETISEAPPSVALVPSSSDSEQSVNTAPFDNSEWTPHDSSYGAAFPVCGWIPKRYRRAIEFAMIILFTFLMVSCVVSLTWVISNAARPEEDALTDDAIAKSLFDDAKAYDDDALNYGKNNDMDDYKDDYNGKDDDSNNNKANDDAGKRRRLGRKYSWMHEHTRATGFNLGLVPLQHSARTRIAATDPHREQKLENSLFNQEILQSGIH